MKHILLILFLFPFFATAQGAESFDAKKETIIFLQQLFQIDSLTLYVKETTTGSEEFFCIISHTDFLKEKERKSVNQKLKTDQNLKWVDNLSSNLKVIADSDFEESDKDSLVEKLKQNVLIISHPIFIRNGKYCFFFYKVICGNICGESDLSLYINEDGIWKKKEEYCSWIH